MNLLDGTETCPPITNIGIDCGVTYDIIENTSETDGVSSKRFAIIFPFYLNSIFKMEIVLIIRQ